MLWSCLKVAGDLTCAIFKAARICSVANHHQEQLVHPCKLEKLIEVMQSFSIFIAEAAFPGLSARVIYIQKHSVA